MNARIVLSGLTLLALTTMSAGAKGPLGSSNCCADRVVCCPNCHCYAKVEEVEIKKHCYEVECEKVCIPKVCFPWHKFCFIKKKCKDDCCDSGCAAAPGCCDGGSCCQEGCPQPCPPRVGCVRSVRVLVKEEYKCKACECVWEICDDNCCDAHGAPAPPEAAVEPPPAPAPAPAPVPPGADVPAAPPIGGDVPAAPPAGGDAPADAPPALDAPPIGDLPAAPKAARARILMPGRTITKLPPVSDEDVRVSKVQLRSSILRLPLTQR